MDKNEIILYQTQDGAINLDVVVENETVWLTQAQIAMLFGVKQPAISKHLKNIFSSKELDEFSVYSILEYTAADGKTYQTGFYNLDAIFSVGYRVNSQNATDFRRWANKVLKDYILKGYAIHERFERLENRVTSTEKKIDFFVRTSLPPKQGVFFEGQIFDAYCLNLDFNKIFLITLICLANHKNHKNQGSDNLQTKGTELLKNMNKQ